MTRSMVAGASLVLALTAMALPVTAQSPSTSPPPLAAAEGESLGAAPSGFTWAPLAMPTGTDADRVSDSTIAPDGSWVALAQPPGLDADPRILRLAPSDTEATVTTIKKASDARLSSLASAGEQLLAIGSGRSWVSPDGSTWEPVKNKLKNYSVTDATGSGQLVVAIADELKSEGLTVLSTADGQNFLQYTIKPRKGDSLNPDLVAVAPTGLTAIAATDRGAAPVLFTDMEGRLDAPALPFDAQPYNGIRNIVPTPSGLMMVVGLEDGTRYQIFTSPDGYAWTQVYEKSDGTIDGDSLVQLPAALGGGFLATGNGIVLTSQDGTTWTETEAPELAGQDVSTATALPDGRIILAIRSSDGDATSLLVGTPQP